LRANAFDVPALTGPIVDSAGVMREQHARYLEDVIRRIYEASQVQLQVLTVPTLGGEPIEQASIAVTDKWKLGKKGSDKGLLLLVAVQDHKVRIEVGQGLEGDLPDVTAHRIIDQIILPRFRSGDISGGIVEGVQTIASIVAPDAGIAPQHKQRRQMNGNWFFITLLILFVLINIFSSFFGGRRGFWGGGGGWYGGGGFGGGGFGGGGGGGWSGGGGGFSGGGSSGSW
jgi:uncharacterized protein